MAEKTSLREASLSGPENPLPGGGRSAPRFSPQALSPSSRLPLPSARLSSSGLKAGASQELGPRPARRERAGEVCPLSEVRPRRGGRSWEDGDEAGEDAEKRRGAGEAGEGPGGPDGGWGRSEEEAFQGCGRVRERRGRPGGGLRPWLLFGGGLLYKVVWVSAGR